MRWNEYKAVWFWAVLLVVQLVLAVARLPWAVVVVTAAGWSLYAALLVRGRARERAQERSYQRGRAEARLSLARRRELLRAKICAGCQACKNPACTGSHYKSCFPNSFGCTDMTATDYCPSCA